MQNFTIKTADLVTAAKRCGGVIERRTTIPVLTMARLYFGADSFEIVTTDCDNEAHATGAAECEGVAEFLVSFENMLSAIDALKDSERVKISFDETEQKAGFSAAGSARVYSFPVLCGDYDETERRPNGKGGYEETATGKRLRTVDDFPILQASELRDVLAVTASADVFANALDSVAAAMSQEETRYYLNGVYFFPPKGNVEAGAVTTDGHRLHLRFLSDCAVSGTAGVIVQKKTVGMLQKILKTERGGVSASFSERFGIFSGNGWRIVSKLVDGSFPDFWRVIPAENKDAVKVTAAARDLISFAKAARKMTADRSKSMGMIANGRLDCFVKNPEAGELRETIPAEIVKPSSWDEDSAVLVGINSGYVADLLADLESVTFQIRDGASPVLIKSPELNGLRVIMPLRIS